ncbi:MAG: ABC transporter ATP-binding protein [Clostridia bacterium]|nr:ABC transporter ATP-binding protein [Clostridia bacterium]
MIKLLKHLKAMEWGFMVFGATFIVMQVWLDLKIPDYMGIITKIAEYGGIYGTINDIWLNGLYMLLCALGSMLCSIITAFFVTKIASNFSARLRSLLYNKTQSFSMAEINKFSNASLITRTTNDVQQVQLIVAIGLQLLIKAPITVVWAIFKIAGKQWQWSVATGVALSIVLVFIIIIVLFVFKKFKIMQKQTDNLNQVTRENLTGLRVIRAFNSESYQEKKFEKANKEFTSTNLFTNKALAFLSPVMSGVSNGLSLAIYWIGAVVISSASLLSVAGLFSDMVIFISYGMQILFSFIMLIMVFMLAPRALVSANRINEVLSTNNSVKDGNGVGPTEEKGTIEFRNVSFRYPDASENVINNISFIVEKGQTVALIGVTGSGKSTIVNLISRYYDATEGQVLVDGHDVKEYTKDELTQKLGYVAQKAVLFSGNIRSNINFGDNNANEEIIKKAVDIAQSSDFVKVEKGELDSHVAQNGANLSGGQKQRLSIARAVARNSEIYIFDDTFSALDYATDKKLRSAIKKDLSGSTSLIVAQRIGTIKNADKIIVIEDGKIVGMGKHKTLLKNCTTYEEIARSQLNEEELNNG